MIQKSSIEELDKAALMKGQLLQPADPDNVSINSGVGLTESTSEVKTKTAVDDSIFQNLYRA